MPLVTYLNDIETAIGLRQGGRGRQERRSSTAPGSAQQRTRRRPARRARDPSDPRAARPGAPAVRQPQPPSTIELERIRVLEWEAGVTHIRYRSVARGFPDAGRSVRGQPPAHVLPLPSPQSDRAGRPRGRRRAGRASPPRRRPPLEGHRVQAPGGVRAPQRPRDRARRRGLGHRLEPRPDLADQHRRARSAPTTSASSRPASPPRTARCGSPTPAATPSTASRPTAARRRYPLRAGAFPIDIVPGRRRRAVVHRGPRRRDRPHHAPTATIDEYPLPTTNAFAGDIAAGPDGAIYFSEQSAGKVGRITTAGADHRVRDARRRRAARPDRRRPRRRALRLRPQQQHDRPHDDGGRVHRRVRRSRARTPTRSR